MKKPRSPIGDDKRFNGGNNFDPDATFVKVSQDSISAEKGPPDKSYEKKIHNTMNTWNCWIGNGHSQSFETESQSLLKVIKNKHIKFTKDDDDDGHFNGVQSQSFLTRDHNNMSDSLLTDDSEIIGPDKRKKRRVKNGDPNETPKKKKKEHHIHFQTQHIFKQESSEDFVSSTPISTPKKVNKKYEFNGLSDKNEDTALINGVNSDDLNASKKQDPDNKLNGLNGFDSIRNGEKSPEFNGTQKEKKKKSRKRKPSSIIWTDSDGQGQNEQELDSYSLNHSVHLDSPSVKEEVRRGSLEEDNIMDGGIKVEIYSPKGENKVVTNKHKSSSSSFEISPSFSAEQKKKKKKSRTEKPSIILPDSDRDVKEHNLNNQILDSNSLKPPISLDNFRIKEDNSLQEDNSDRTAPAEINSIKSKRKTTSESLARNSDRAESQLGENNFTVSDINSLFESSTIKKAKKKSKHDSVSSEQHVDSTAPAEINSIKSKRKSKNDSLARNSDETESQLGDGNFTINDINSLVEANTIKKVEKKSKHGSVSSEQHVDSTAPAEINSIKSKRKSKNDSLARNSDDTESQLGDGNFTISGISSLVEASTIKKVKNKPKHESVSSEQHVDLNLGQDVAAFKGAKKKHKKKSKERDSTSMDYKKEISDPNQSLNEKSLKGSMLSTEDVSSLSRVSDDDEDVSPKDEAQDEKRQFASLQALLQDKPSEVDFEVPELHKILDRASKPTISQRTQIVLRGLPLKFGKYTKIEDKQIRENWKQFTETYNLENKPEMFFRLDKRYIPATFKKVFLFHLARNMPERTPYGVFRRFKLLMAQTKRGRFNENEDSLIKGLLKSKDKPHIVEIAQRLQRPATSIATRIKLLENKHTRKIKWRRHNAAAFITYLLKYTKIAEKNIQNLEGRHITSKEWKRLSKKLDNVPVRILKRTWLEKLHPALFMPDDFYDLRQIKVKLIKMFRDNEETEWRTVKWSWYASKFKGLTYLRIYSLMQQLVRFHVPTSKRGNLKKCLKVLSKVPEEQIARRLIYKIKYENGKVFEMKPKKRG